MAGFYDGKNTDFWIVRVDLVVPTHVAFEAKRRQEVETFYQATLAAGAQLFGSPRRRRAQRLQLHSDMARRHRGIGHR